MEKKKLSLLQSEIPSWKQLRDMTFLSKPSEAEEDMLDQAYGLTATSRLGCQVKITADMDNIRVTLPKATRNFYVDGHVPKHH
eukprot:gene28457-34354_t